MPTGCIFLLGVIAAKWRVNHRRRRLVVPLSLNREPTARAMRQRFGCTVYHKRSPAGNTSLVCEFNSASSLDRLKAAVVRFRHAVTADFAADYLAFWRAAGRL